MTPEEFAVILEDFRARSLGNKIVQKMLKEWTRNILVTATDVAAGPGGTGGSGAAGDEGLGGRTWTIVVDNGQIARIAPEAVEPRHVHIHAPIAALAGIFRGELNPAKEFAAGNLKFIGSGKDEMRLDAVIDYIWE